MNDWSPMGNLTEQRELVEEVLMENEWKNATPVQAFTIECNFFGKLWGRPSVTGIIFELHDHQFPDVKPGYILKDGFLLVTNPNKHFKLRAGINTHDYGLLFDITYQVKANDHLPQSFDVTAILRARPCFNTLAPIAGLDNDRKIAYGLEIISVKTVKAKRKAKALGYSRALKAQVKYNYVRVL